MAQLRHSLVAVLSVDRDILDVACGSGYALPLIAEKARSVTACDLDPINIQDSRTALPGGHFAVADAEKLSFPERSFDVVACIEAIYYFHNWSRFVHNVVGLLRPAGTLVVSWPNPARPSFSPSPSSIYYPSPEEMVAVAASAGFAGICYGAFPFDNLITAHRPWLDVLRRIVVRAGLIPHSLKLRMLIKWVLYKRLKPLSEISLLADPFHHLVQLDAGVNTNFTMLYFIGTRRAESS